MNTKFSGFPAGKSGMIQVPTLFFTDLLLQIDDLAELKLTIYAFWALHQREGTYRYMRLRDLVDDHKFLSGFAVDLNEAKEILSDALARAVTRGTLLHMQVPGQPIENLYFMNTDKGRKAIAALERGDWIPGDLHQPVKLITERPNIFALYEQNIGPLTPMLGDILRDAETTYPAEWIEEAIGISVESNKRTWRYVEAILKRWAVEGRTPPREQTTTSTVNPYLRDPYFQRDQDITELSDDE